MSPEGWIGWDLGGANLKAVRLDDGGAVCSVAQVACPLWQGLDRLELGIDAVLSGLGPGPRRHAVTMTGELADLFSSRAEGVGKLVGLMQARFAGETLRIYAGRAGLVGPEAAVGLAAQVASANWLATGSLAAARLGEGAVVDIGSTTADLVPFADFEVAAWGGSDHDRLVHGELVYSGVVRTPIMALAHRVPFDGAWVSLMAEHFATTADVYRLLKVLPDHADLLPTADGRAKTLEASATRLARMLGLDVAMAERADWVRLADYLSEVQLRTYADAAACVLSRGEVGATAPIVGAGVGRFLAHRLAERLGRPYVGFESLLPCRWGGVPDVSDCAPAAAVASLAADMSRQ